MLSSLLFVQVIVLLFYDGYNIKDHYIKKGASNIHVQKGAAPCYVRTLHKAHTRSSHMLYLTSVVHVHVLLWPTGLSLWLISTNICLCHVCIVYVVMEVVSFWGAWSINECGICTQAARCLTQLTACSLIM